MKVLTGERLMLLLYLFFVLGGKVLSYPNC